MPLNFLPSGWIRRKLYNLAIRLLKKYSPKQPEIQVVNLQSKHIANARLIADRVELLKCLPRNGVVAELGVDVGAFSERILSINEPQKLHLIDIWDNETYGQVKKEHVKNRFSEHIKNGQVVIQVGLSTVVVADFPDKYFDWIYIDTDHYYKTTLSELEMYRSKLKDNGIIAGHDFIPGYWNGYVKYGVIEAVSEFCNKYDWELIFMTTEISEHPSFAIRKI